MKTTVIATAVALSGAFLSLLAMGGTDGKPSCLCRLAADGKPTNAAPESKGMVVKEVERTDDTSDGSTHSCLLAPAELAARRSMTHTEIIAKADEIIEIDDGYKLKFDEADDELIGMLAEWIAVERKCCNFLRFGLEIEAYSGPVWFAVGGDGGAKQFLKGVMTP